MLKEIKRGLLRNNGDIKQTGMKNHIVRIIPLVNSHSNPVRSSSNLNNSISNTTIILLTLLSRNHKESIRQFKKSSIIHIANQTLIFIEFIQMHAYPLQSYQCAPVQGIHYKPVQCVPVQGIHYKPVQCAPIQGNQFKVVTVVIEITTVTTVTTRKLQKLFLITALRALSILIKRNAAERAAINLLP